MRIYISGILGFVPSNLANKLHDLGYYVSGCDNLFTGVPANLNPGISYQEMDFKDITEEVINKYDVLVHMACKNIIYCQKNPIDTFKTNAFESIKLIEKFNGKIVYTSTSSVYGQADVIPTTEDCPENLSNAYDQSKAILEKYLQLRGNYTTLRLSNVYGPNQRPENPYCGVVGNFINRIINNEPVTINGDGNDTRDYTFVDDVVRSIIIAIDKSPKNTEINIGTGKETSAFNLAVQIGNILGKVPNINFVGKRSIDKINRRCLDISKASKLLGWSPMINLEEGLQKTIEWQRREYEKR